MKILNLNLALSLLFVCKNKKDRTWHKDERRRLKQTCSVKSEGRKREKIQKVENEDDFNTLWSVTRWLNLIQKCW